MKILVTGGSGQLGYEICMELKKRNLCFVAPNRSLLDISDEKQTQDFILETKPELIIHCAAYTNVDKAEEESHLCYKINVSGTKNLVQVAKKIHSKFMYISSDYVFDGKKKSPYEINDRTNPINYYGQTKLEGEIAVRDTINKHFIVRTSWLYGNRGSNFVKKIVSAAKTKKKLQVVCDQIGSPTYAPDLAKILCDIAVSEKYGLYHATNEGFCSWFDFAKKIFEHLNVDVDLVPVLSKDFPTKAIRPLNSCLNKDSLLKNGFYKLRTWDENINKIVF